MQCFVDGLVQQCLVLDDGFHLQGHVADNHRKGEVLHRPCARNGLEPFTLRVGTAVQYALEGLAGDIGPVLFPSSHCQLGKAHAGKGVGKDVIRRYDGLSFAG